MSGQKKSYKHEKPVDNFNDDFLDYIVHSVYDADEIEDDEPSLGFLDDFRDVIRDAKTRREARNRLIRAAREKGPEFFANAINDYNLDYGNKEAGIEYTPTSFDVDKLKMRPILAKEMPLEDVNAYVDKLAKLMGYSDNGKERGAVESLLKDFYGNGFLDNLTGGHAGDYSFFKENSAIADAIKRKFNSIEGSEILRRELGYNPSISDEDLFNVDKGIPSFTQRAFRAKARSGDWPNKVISFVEGIVAPQTAGALDEGRTPQVPDIGTDAIETAMLGPAKIGKSIMKVPLKAIGFETALDVLHDAIKGATDDKVYSDDSKPLSGNDDFSVGNVLDVKGRLPSIVQAAMFNRVGGRVQNKLEKMIGDKIKLPKPAETSELFENLASANKEKRFLKENLKSINAQRKRTGMNALSEKEYSIDLDNRIKEINAEIRKNRAKTALENLLNGTARTGTARAFYNPQSSPALVKSGMDILLSIGKNN